METLASDANAILRKGPFGARARKVMRDLLAALAAETARANREADTRQEAERKLGDSNVQRNAFDRECKRLRANMRDIEAERDRLRAELAVLRG